MIFKYFIFKYFQTFQKISGDCDWYNMRVRKIFFILWESDAKQLAYQYQGDILHLPKKNIYITICIPEWLRNKTKYQVLTVSCKGVI